MVDCLPTKYIAVHYLLLVFAIFILLYKAYGGGWRRVIMFTIAAVIWPVVLPFMFIFSCSSGVTHDKQ